MASPKTAAVDLSGDYRLRAVLWRQTISAPTDPVVRYNDHRRGDTVTVDHDEAVRLLRDDLVEPLDAEGVALVERAAAAGIQVRRRPHGSDVIQAFPALPLVGPTVDNPSGVMALPAGFHY